MNGVIVGKRITVGATVQGALTGVVWGLNEFVLASPIPASVALGAATAITFPLQLWVVNKFGVTTQS